jgi:hypothetical protein
MMNILFQSMLVILLYLWQKRTIYVPPRCTITVCLHTRLESYFSLLTQRLSDSKHSTLHTKLQGMNLTTLIVLVSALLHTVISLRVPQEAGDLLST